jgi:ABC-type phosphate transport system substrate-binding protein
MSHYFHALRRGSVVFCALFAGILTVTLISPSFLRSTFLPSAQAAGGDIAVVVRPDLPVDGLTLAQTRKLLLGEQQFWNPNLRVTLLLRAPSARERDVVLKVIYGMNEAEFRQYWISKMFRAEVTSGPKVVYSNEMATELVTALPGSVAFVDASQVPKGLKILKIDGKLPGQPGYPLK